MRRDLVAAEETMVDWRFDLKNALEAVVYEFLRRTLTCHVEPPQESPRQKWRELRVAPFPSSWTLQGPRFEAAMVLKPWTDLDIELF